MPKKDMVFFLITGEKEMTEQKWTQGPWVVKYSNGTIQLQTPYEVTMCDETYYPWVPYNYADWHLIAAAPDLYDALEVLLSHVETSEDVGNEVWIETHHKHVDAAFKALAKARGET